MSLAQATKTQPESAAEFADRLLTEDEAADFLGVKPQTLGNWRCTGRYDLAYIKVGRLVRYRLSVLKKFLIENTVGTSAE